MSNLAVDVGNTSTAMMLGGQVFHVDGGFEAAKATALEAIDKAAAIDYVSVVPEADAKWREFAAAHGKELRQVEFGKGLKLKYDYPRPRRSARTVCATRRRRWRSTARRCW